MHLVINLMYMPSLLEAQIGLSSLLRNSKRKLKALQTWYSYN